MMARTIFFMTPQQFIAKWGPGGPAFELNERQGAQPHFIDLCQLLCVPLPGSDGDYTAHMPDEEILKWLLVLNLERAG
jgi:hypothetical protein